MSAKPRTSRASHEGQSLVELAISIMVIVMLVVGAADFGLAFFSYVAMRDAAQEGALYGSFAPYVDANGDGFYNNGESPNVAGVRARVRATSRAPVDFANTVRIPDSYITVALDPATGRACEGNVDVSGVPTPHAMRVTIQYDYHLMTPLLGAILGTQTIHLTATVTDTILEPRCPAL